MSPGSRDYRVATALATSTPSSTRRHPRRPSPLALSPSPPDLCYRALAARSDCQTHGLWNSKAARGLRRSRSRVLPHCHDHDVPRISIAPRQTPAAPLAIPPLSPSQRCHPHHISTGLDSLPPSPSTSHAVAAGIVRSPCARTAKVAAPGHRRGARQVLCALPRYAARKQLRVSLRTASERSGARTRRTLQPAKSRAFERKTDVDSPPSPLLFGNDVVSHVWAVMSSPRQLTIFAQHRKTANSPDHVAVTCE
ncbi:hypothetical protein CERSUDRAFT_101053 [Gelatoporia subvermispora B]|uniref:Uncharacterized protein n=1 Tax=Ceriporiopsis subvermispora (strain B) TaxID=914234 RepID=M2QW34_CERS8|nr:hypothetical protein CERSUDRAFT_101053 [Gelatoporia subvermispora B]